MNLVITIPLVSNHSIPGEANECIDDNVEYLQAVEREKIPILENVLFNHPAFLPKETKALITQPQFTESKIIEYTPYMYSTPADTHRKDIYPVESIDTADINIQVGTVKLEVLQPFATDITCVVDTGSSINCIGANIAIKYKQYLKRERRAFIIRTGNGNCHGQAYLPIIIQDPYKDRIIKTNFYVLESLPYNWLMGRSLIHLTGSYNSIETAIETYHHKPQMLDSIDADTFSCTRYPTEEDDKDIDLSKATYGRPEMKNDIMKILNDYNNVLAKDEMDIGEIPGVEFKIEWKDGIQPVQPVACREYPHPRTHIAEIERQLRHLQQKGFIREST